MPDELSRRALNRATLARQLLLVRATIDPLDAVGHLVGLQAQVPRDPYVALWSRLDAFDPDVVGGLVASRRLVRIVVMRGTIHLVTPDDCLLLRPLVQPVLTAELNRHRDHAPRLRDVDLGPVLDLARSVLADEPMTPTRLGATLAAAFPGLDGAAAAYACRNHLALVQVPPRGVWGRRGQVVVTTAESWLGRPLVAAPSIDDVVLRYLGAFGPALPADVAAWSRLTGFREVVDRLRPRLRTFRDERGRELVDLPEAPRPDPATPAPVRFLPEYDNALLSHADRSRYAPDDSTIITSDGPIHGTALVDGFVGATWSVEHDADRATLTVRHVTAPRRAVADLESEGARLLHLLHPDATTADVRLVPVS